MSWRKSGLAGWLRRLGVGCIALAGASPLAGCRLPSSGQPVRSAGEIDLGLRRGVSWTAFLLKRGRVSGSTASLEIKRGQIVGFLDGAPVRLETKPDELSGSVGGSADPSRAAERKNMGGRVQVDIEEVDGKLEIGGTWNDERVHFEITPETLKGTITGRALGSCQYVLDKIDPEGIRSGTSICRGLPEATRLEFPKAVENWLTRGEAVAVLLALLSSAPPTSTD